MRHRRDITLGGGWHVRRRIDEALQFGDQTLALPTIEPDAALTGHSDPIFGVGAKIEDRYVSVINGAARDDAAALLVVGDIDGHCARASIEASKTMRAGPRMRTEP